MPRTSNLGWKLAAKIRSDVHLLDTYQEERHPAAARVLHHTAAQRVPTPTAASPG